MDRPNLRNTAPVLDPTSWLITSLFVVVSELVLKREIMFSADVVHIFSSTGSTMQGIISLTGAAIP
jgi:hypothetical protein